MDLFGCDALGDSNAWKWTELGLLVFSIAAAEVRRQRPTFSVAGQGEGPSAQRTGTHGAAVLFIWPMSEQLHTVAQNSHRTPTQ